MGCLSRALSIAHLIYVQDHVHNEMRCFVKIYARFLEHRSVIAAPSTADSGELNTYDTLVS